MQGKGKMVALATTRQTRQFTGEKNIWDLTLERYEAGRDARALYRAMSQNCATVKSVYELPMPLPMMKKRVRLLFEMNRHVKDPLCIRGLINEARNEMNMALAGIYTSPAYLTSRWFGRHIDHTVLLHSVTAFRSREINIGRSRLREKARAIAHGESDAPGLPGPTYDEDGNRTGYYHPKGALPTGESELFARPPERKDWGSFSLPDPWNPKNSPDGPPDPHLCKNVEHVHRINLARKGPYTRHRTRRLIEHEAKVRDMSEYEYLMYFGENEVHLAANAFELPEYDWAESRMDRRIRRAQHENQAIFRPARQAWLDQYKAQWKGVNYQPAIDYWLQVFKQWVPNYSTRVVESVDTIDAEWDAFISVPAHYAAYRSSAFAATISNADATPLARTMLDFVSAAQPSQPNTSQRPYDHPSFTNKWYTDNGLESLLILKEDVEAGLGCPRKGERVLQAEMNKLKDEIGCVELTEQRFKGEWWNRGQIKLLRTLDKIHDMELIKEILCKANVADNATQKDAEKALAATNFDGFTFTNFTYLRYPDGDAKGVHSWAVGENGEEKLQEKWAAAFQNIYNYEQCVPVWVQGLSKRTVYNKSAAEGGWTLEGEKPFWDKLVSA